MDEKMYISPTRIRAAAKAVLFDCRGDVVLAAGKHGMLNLPGGGYEDGESPEDALYREMIEEGVPEETLVCRLTKLEGDPVCGPGRSEWLEWQVFYGTLTVPAATLTPCNEITRIEGIRPDKALDMSYPAVSNLAVRSISRVLQCR